MKISTLRIILIVILTLSIVPSFYVWLDYTLATGKGTLHMYDHSPISYINQPIDLDTAGILQQYKFKNIVIGNYVIAAKIISELSKSYHCNGEFEISIYDSGKNMVDNFFTRCRFDKTGYKIYITQNWSKDPNIGTTEYYQLGEITLNKIDDYILEIKTIKGIPTEEVKDNVKIEYKKGKYEIGVYPLEYNYKIHERKLFRATWLKTSPTTVSALALIVIYLFGFFRRKRKGRQQPFS